MTFNSNKPTVLVLGSTGQVGRPIAKELTNNTGINLRLTSRRHEEVARLRAEGHDVMYLDLDDPKSFGAALSGVDRLFLLTGYTVAMLAQSKALVDAAKKAGVDHIVHLGVFAEWDCTAPHFAWHLLVESYIKSSGMAWTNLHPNMFMENLLSFFVPKKDILTLYWEHHRMGWVAAGDIASVAAAILREGPKRHHGQDYWMSTEALDGRQVAAVLSDVTGRDIRSDLQGPDDFKRLFTSSHIPVESWYAEGGVEFARQVCNGQMGYIGSVRDDVPHVTGRPATTFKQWATEHRAEFLAATLQAI